jgi:hypothetical protein
VARPGPPSWPDTIGDRLRFERGARRAFPTLTGRPRRRSGRGGFTYTVIVDVPFYATRVVTIRFKSRSTTPYVTVDGPSDSPHRYDDGTLCMWFPGDPDENVWTFDRGLLDLLDTVVAHLFREAWWRETGEWLGSEIPHRPTHTRVAA